MSKKYKLFPTKPYPLGVRREGKDILVSMVSGVEDCGIILYSNKEKLADEEKVLRIAFPTECRIGHVYSMKIEEVPTHYNEYQLYHGEKIFVDTLGTCYKKYPYGTVRGKTNMIGMFADAAFDWGKERKPALKFSDSVFYGLHVRGFTMGADSNFRHKGTFAGVQEKLEYLLDLGITSIILMPAYEFIENEQSIKGKGASNQSTLNYWGYKSGYYYAPKASYASSKNPCVEFKQLVKSCHEKGMELFMQFYFSEEMSDAEAVRVLEFWVMEYHVDGFQIMTEKKHVLAAEKSPILADTKLIFREFADVRESGRHVSGAKDFLKRLCIYNDEAMQDYRRFLKGDDFMTDAFLYHFSKNDKAKAYMNSIADYHGFRLADIVSYNEKHNDANAEDNADGTDENFSWNCGVEGPTEHSRILMLRKQQMKNALSFVCLSQGTPYLFMGDEMGCTQQGNNNPYNQDNEISWMDWTCLQQNSEIYQYTKDLLSYRKANAILHGDEPLDGRDYSGLGFPNISFHAREAYRVVYEENGKAVGVMLCGNADVRAGEKTEPTCKVIYIACNMQWIGRRLAMPKLKGDATWQVVMKTCVEEPFLIQQSSFLEVPPRSVVVLEAELLKADKTKAKHITAF